MMNRMLMQNRDTRWDWLYKLGGVGALMAGALFLIPIIEITITRLQPDRINGWLSLLQNNWLVVIFKRMPGLRKSNQPVVHTKF
jgi:hypothetical protein